ncbi:hypothetical protein BC827DRAFT_1135084 [Russula dissimulans]|nr:hypothetical protein BC827DRAFT_1135084 [Russula dissimulans]
MQEQILHDRVNLVRLVRRLDKTVNESDWGSERGITPWLRSEQSLQQLKYARKLLNNLEVYNKSHPSTKLQRRLTDIRGVLDTLDSSLLSVNERVAPEPPRLEPMLPTLPPARPYSRTADLPAFQRLAPPSDVTSGPLNEAEPPAANVNLLLGVAEEVVEEEEDSSALPPERAPNADSAPTNASPPPRLSAPASDSASNEKALLQHSTALQEELSVQLAQMAGQLRRNAEHFSSALAADQAVLQTTEEKVGANLDVMKRERVRLRDHRGKSLGTTCLTISSVLVVTVAFIVMLFIRRFT